MIGIKKSVIENSLPERALLPRLTVRNFDCGVLELGCGLWDRANQHYLYRAAIVFTVHSRVVTKKLIVARVSSD